MSDHSQEGKRREDSMTYWQKNPMLFVTIFGWLISLSFWFGIHVAQANERDMKIKAISDEIRDISGYVHETTKNMAVLSERFASHISLSNSLINELRLEDKPQKRR